MPVDWEAEPAAAVPVRDQPERVEIRTLSHALTWGDGWMRAHARLENEYCRLQWRIEYYESLLRHLDPYLPRWLQDEEQRAANEPLYETLAQYRADTLD